MSDLAQRSPTASDAQHSPAVESAAKPQSLWSRLGTFSSLRHRDYRLLWTGTLFSSSGWWLQQSSVGWLTYFLTGSPFALGVVNGLQSLPLLVLAPFGGVAADRVNRKRLLLSTQLFLVILCAIFATLVLTNQVHVWTVGVFTLLTGVAWAFNMPIRQSIVVNLVPREDLMNALALSSAGFNVTRIVGPSIAGFLIIAAGIAGNFYIQSLMYVGVAAMVFLMVIPPREGAPSTGSPMRNLKEGAQYVWSQPTIRAQLGLALVPVVVALPYVSLMPVFAQDVLEVGAAGFGLMMAAPGVGAVAGTLLLATFSNTERKGRLLFMALAGLGVGLVLFATSRSFPFSLLMLVVIGGCQMTFLTTNQTLLHMSVPDEFRGRVMGLYMLNQGLLPFGSLFIGAMADVWSAPFAVTVMAALLIVLTILAFVTMPSLRDS